MINVPMSFQQLLDLYCAVRRNICDGNRSHADMLEPLVRANLPEIINIPLTKGYYAQIDRPDFDRVIAHNWFVMEAKVGGNLCIYAGTRVLEGGKQTTLRMHRLIASSDDALMVDHVNGDGLDNRRINLREATRTQNRRNSRKKQGGTSRFLGVSLDKTRVASGRTGVWQASISHKIEGRKLHRKLGTFATEEEAARAYDRAAAIAYGDFAQLNFPKDMSEREAA